MNIDLSSINALLDNFIMEDERVIFEKSQKLGSFTKLKEKKTLDIKIEEEEIALLNNRINAVKLDILNKDCTLKASIETRIESLKGNGAMLIDILAFLRMQNTQLDVEIARWKSLGFEFTTKQNNEILLYFNNQHFLFKLAKPSSLQKIANIYQANKALLKDDYKHTNDYKLAITFLLECFFNFDGTKVFLTENDIEEETSLDIISLLMFTREYLLERYLPFCVSI